MHGLTYSFVRDTHKGPYIKTILVQIIILSRAPIDAWSK